MNSESTGYGAMMIAIVVGLGIILYGIFTHGLETYGVYSILGGGAIVLLCILWMTLQAAALDH